MRILLLVFFLLSSILNTYSQDRILYNLDSYKRVDINLRTTLFSPDFELSYDNKLNVPGRNKNYNINVGGRYTDTHLINDETNQKMRYQNLQLGFKSGSTKKVTLHYLYQFENRSYNESKYFKNGFSVDTDIFYNEDSNSFSSYLQYLKAEYEIGFGFGRLEVINNAWIGARILEELDSKNILKIIPDADEMKLFFDLIGDLEFERVLDNRLKDIYIIEKIIEFVENKKWVDAGSVKAFVTIYDALRYEDFFVRMSGERLEFTLKPNIEGRYRWRNNLNFITEKYIRPGFEGNIEYEIHKNGDLEYYSTKLFGGRITHFEIFQEGLVQNLKTIAGDLYFQYQYKYIPSLRTNLTLSTNFSGGFVYSNSWDAQITVSTSLAYNYYFSPSTQLVFFASTYYYDNRFQVGDYQPQILGMISFNIVHAIR